jgi:hypothetical protein
MNVVFDIVRRTIGFGPTGIELYNRAFNRGVLLKDFNRAAKIFYDAASKFSEEGDQIMAARAGANSLLYTYLGTEDSSILSSLLQALGGLQHIEKVGLQTEMMPIEPLRLELECRAIEAAISREQNDSVRLRDLHKRASDTFDAMHLHPLITYEYIASEDGHDEKASDRHFYHDGMYHYYEAMIEAESDPAAACARLMRSKQAFQDCNDPSMLQMVATLLEKWRIKRTCWLCGREMQGLELHFWMRSAKVVPYTGHDGESVNRHGFSIDLEHRQVAVCTPCLSMITFKAAEEAEKVRKELTAELQKEREKVEEANTLIQALNNRVSQLEFERRGN